MTHTKERVRLEHHVCLIPEKLCAEGHLTPIRRAVSQGDCCVLSACTVTGSTLQNASKGHKDTVLPIALLEQNSQISM
jgi:hypothetical protein